MLSAGEAQRVAEAVQCGSTIDPKADAAVVSLVTGHSAFRRALIARFGEEAVEGFLQRWSLLRVPTEGLDQARERITGQFATLEIPGRSPLRFTMTREGWRLLLPDAGDPRSLAQFNLAGTIMLQIAAELETGKQASPDETLLGLQTQLSILK
jgi:hypothetical protein